MFDLEEWREISHVSLIVRIGVALRGRRRVAIIGGDENRCGFVGIIVVIVVQSAMRGVGLRGDRIQYSAGIVRDARW